MITLTLLLAIAWPHLEYLPVENGGYIFTRRHVFYFWRNSPNDRLKFGMERR